MNTQEAIPLINKLITLMGENTDRTGLQNTSYNIWNVLLNYTKGYRTNILDFFSKTIETDYDDVITLSPIPFQSLCEHHMIPMFGDIHFSYHPNKKIIGLGRIIDFIDTLCSKLQLQENLTKEIGNVFFENLKPKGVYVKIIAQHSCLFHHKKERENIKLKTFCKIGEIKTKEENPAL